MPMTSEEAQAFLRKIQEAVHKVVEDSAGKEDVFYYLVIRHPASHMTIHTGNGCPVCFIASSVQWMIENRIPHDDGESVPVYYPEKDFTKH